mgnify:CR=1 FL=1
MSLLAMRQEVVSLFNRGVLAADPYPVIKKTISQTSQQIRLGRIEGNWDRIHILAIGKAACKMLSATLEQISASNIVFPVIAVTNSENVYPIAGADVYVSGHPNPDQHGIVATQAVIKKLNDCKPGELLLVLLSGGGSALLPAPAPTIELSDKIALNHLLLASGADINEINCVRKHCSTLKGGGLARHAQGADVVCLAVSDVMNDDPSSIASGPTQADPTCFTDAIHILEKYALWNAVPDSIKHYLSEGAKGLRPETLKACNELLGLNHFEIIASNKQSVTAITEALNNTNYHLGIIINELKGEASQVAGLLAEQIKSSVNNVKNTPFALLAGGETTVTIGSESGLGGRNQELALAFAMHVERIGLNGHWCFLSAGTDGRDGPTDAAGAIVDHNTLTRVRAAGFDPDQALKAHNSYAALDSSHDLLRTGATGTNVADLQILLWKPINYSGDQYV